MIRFLGLAFFLAPVLLLAENNVNVYPKTPNKPNGSVNVFDDNFFEPKKEVAPETVKSPLTGAERPVASESKLNVEQSAQARMACDAQSGNRDAYQQCYRGKVKEMTQAIQSGQDAIEGKQKDTFRNTTSVPLMDETLQQNNSEERGNND